MSGRHQKPVAYDIVQHQDVGGMQAETPVGRVLRRYELELLGVQWLVDADPVIFSTAVLFLVPPTEHEGNNPDEDQGGRRNEDSPHKREDIRRVSQSAPP